MAKIYCVYQFQIDDYTILTDYETNNEFFVDKEKAVLFLMKLYNLVLDQNPQWVVEGEEFTYLNFTCYIGSYNLDSTFK